MTTRTRTSEREERVRETKIAEQKYIEKLPRLMFFFFFVTRLMVYFLFFMNPDTRTLSFLRSQSILLGSLPHFYFNAGLLLFLPHLLLMRAK